MKFLQRRFHQDLRQDFHQDFFQLNLTPCSKGNSGTQTFVDHISWQVCSHAKIKFIFSVIILLRPGMRNAFNMLLISLSTMDSFFIILAIGDYSIAR